MSIASEITRLQNAKLSLKTTIESVHSTSIPSSETLDKYANYVVFSGCYMSPPTVNGVYIKYVGGKYSDYNVLWPGQTPVGIGVKTSQTSFVIHPKLIKRNILSQQYSGNSLTQYRSSSAALTDFSGKIATQTLTSYSGASSAFSYMNSSPFADGSKGYFPSVGQLDAIKLNLGSISTAMNFIGGWDLSETSLQTVSFSNSNNAYSYFSITYYGYYSNWSAYMFWIWYADGLSYQPYFSGVGDVHSFVLTDFNSEYIQ